MCTVEVERFGVPVANGGGETKPLARDGFRRERVRALVFFYLKRDTAAGDMNAAWPIIANYFDTLCLSLAR